MFYVFGIKFGKEAPPPAPASGSVPAKTRLQIAQERAAALEARASEEEAILMAEEDAEYARDLLVEVRQTRRARRRPVATPDTSTSAETGTPS